MPSTTTVPSASVGLAVSAGPAGFAGAAGGAARRRGGRGRGRARDRAARAARAERDGGRGGQRDEGQHTSADHGVLRDAAGRPARGCRFHGCGCRRRFTALRLGCDDHAMAPRQPLLHDLAITLRAPTVCLSAPDGQLRGSGTQGVLCADVRVLARRGCHGRRCRAGADRARRDGRLDGALRGDPARRRRPRRGSDDLAPARPHRAPRRPSRDIHAGQPVRPGRCRRAEAGR